MEVPTTKIKKVGKTCNIETDACTCQRKRVTSIRSANKIEVRCKCLMVGSEKCGHTSVLHFGVWMLAVNRTVNVGLIMARKIHTGVHEHKKTLSIL